MPSKGYTQIKTFPVPVGVLDTMIFEIERGRACDSLQKAQLRLILATQEELSSQGKVIVLQTEQVANLKALSGAKDKQLQNANDLFLIEKSELKQKVKKQRRAIFGLSGITLILVAILVL